MPVYCLYVLGIMKEVKDDQYNSSFRSESRARWPMFTRLWRAPSIDVFPAYDEQLASQHG